MAICEFEFFHGAVLTKLVRSDKPVTLRMIETRTRSAWSSYTLNDEVNLFIKHSTTPHPVETIRNARSWSFGFSIEQLHQMAECPRPVYVALVCGCRDVKDNRMHVCLLYPDEVEELVDVSSATPENVTVRYLPRKSLRVFKDRQERFIVPQNRLDEWSVPGS